VRVYGHETIDTTLTRKTASRDYLLPVPETDTGRMAEKAKVREITSEGLQTEFASYNPISAEVALRNDGKSRGWGTVKFSTKDDASAAVNGMQGIEIDGRQIETRIDRKA